MADEIAELRAGSPSSSAGSRCSSSRPAPPTGRPTPPRRRRSPTRSGCCSSAGETRKAAKLYMQQTGAGIGETAAALGELPKEISAPRRRRLRAAARGSLEIDGQPARRARPAPTCSSTRDNPVDWYPWGPEALEPGARARPPDPALDRLLGLPLVPRDGARVVRGRRRRRGYMNEHFVPVKVDREERPDVDAIYMEAVQGMTGQGGWPLTAFCDPEGVPFYGGTYFPPEPRQGMPSFAMVMEAVDQSWATQREQIAEAAAPRSATAWRPSADSSPADERARARGRRGRGRASCARPPTCEHGGFGGAPKFPPASALELLLAPRRAERRRADARRDGGRRDLRPDRRRLRPLLGRRDLARPPLREDALRQRAARPRLPARLPGARPRALARGLPSGRSTGRCPRCAGPRAASTRRSTPTPRARRAASTSGPRTRSARRSARPGSRSSPTR